MEARVSEMSRTVVEQMESLKPFGMGNPKPTVLLRGVTVRSAQGDCAWIEDGAHRLRVRGKLPPCDGSGACDAVVTPVMVSEEAAAAVCDLRARPGEEFSGRAGEAVSASA